MQRSLDAHKQEMSLFTNHRNALNRRIQQGQHLVWLFCAWAILSVAFVVLVAHFPGPGITIILPLLFGSMCPFFWLADHRAHPRRSGGFLFEKSGLFRSHTAGTMARLGYVNTRDVLLRDANHDGTASGIGLGTIAIDPRIHDNDVSANCDERFTCAVLTDPHFCERRSYSYKPLVGKDIRLIRLNPVSSEPLKVEADLIHVSFATAQELGYVALSYTWGSMEATETILLDEKCFKVRPNVHVILRQLRTCGHIHVWIDAICTNQSDGSERSAQVTRMPVIYAGAGAVIVSIEAAATTQARTVLKLLDQVDISTPANSEPQDVAGLIKDHESLAALESFCNDKYWSRIWIVQEYAVASKIQFLIQGSLVAAQKFHHLLHMSGFGLGPGRQEQARAIYDIRNSFQNDQPFQLVRILAHTKSSMCERRHDRVFGLTGLLLDALNYLLEPDYDVDLKRSALSMARAYIQNESPDIILLAPHCHPGSTLPTWCPDFFRFDDYPPDNRVVDLVSKTDIRRIPGQFDDVAVRKATGSSKSNIIYRGDVLLTSATRIGTVRSLGRAWMDDSQSPFPMHDQNWTRHISTAGLEKEFYKAVYAARPGREYYVKQVHGHSFVRAFDTSHGARPANDRLKGMVDWLCSNRKFFTGAQTMENHARPFSMRGMWPYLTHGFRALSAEYCWEEEMSFNVVWNRFIEIAQSNMRLMCLDDGPRCGIGWAATPARLRDEVFLIPGCSVPVILRRVGQGQFQLVGDAIVPGAMNNEIWGQVQPNELLNIEIV